MHPATGSVTPIERRGRAERLATAQPKAAQVSVGEHHGLIRAVVHGPVRRTLAPDQERAKPRLVQNAKIEIDHRARR
jgi:hypothetical protein